MTQEDEARRWLRAASGALLVAHAVAFGAERCTGTADPFNMPRLAFQQQQQPQQAAARRELALVRPPRESHAGAAFMQPRSLASRAGEPRFFSQRGYLRWLCGML